jgi:hypothetical protein
VGPKSSPLALVGGGGEEEELGEEEACDGMALWPTSAFVKAIGSQGECK